MVKFNNPLGKKTKYIDVPSAEKKVSTDESQGNFCCPKCSVLMSEAQKSKNNHHCPNCKHHFALNALQRIIYLCDSNSFEETNSNLCSQNILDFPDYNEKLDEAKQETGLSEAIITGKAQIGGCDVVIGAMDTRFIMGSMGSVVGEKILLSIEDAIDNSLPLILICSSGGARMQEGIISLMQMAKTSAALNRLHEAGLLYISILTHPTTGGVTASFASLADIIIVEHGAQVGFTGPRVISQTINKKLPEHFQGSKFLLEHGMVDLAVSREQMRQTLSQLLWLHQGG
ncbi:Acetyl-coenzyme A carboxyl transferase beta chain [Candidatus Syntrophocurvum alkaliphilum]|uniref:Acetyl-coenzyme A carboxylase carboxyl transferase subunit beta n=1 Tax=Candidatus Syntrophocurvum alkaliphilum TaxID=2293317 RepID=A0A6I6DGA7_9FIRM|nr:acetyl-CoA carboxylase, carboxyltransferase subunit beta [Candidatus Syntrophocurvum alkaliphilum]QGT98709.1 Acetyl-coenzyme A carboxyl transferase beta chain [Candidatus Syntrophocurvum alkaliphilum]